MAVAVAAGVLSAQQPVPPQPPPATTAPAQPAPPVSSDQAKPAVPEGVTPPPDYVIGAEDVLSIVVWREKELSAEVTVRPDGKVTLPLLNDVDAAGLTPEQLRQQLTTAATRYVADPIVTVLVRAINSRKVYITGEVRNPGIYPLVAPTTVLQLIARAGGTTEYAKTKDIGVLRTEGSRTLRLPFNYRDVSRGKKMEQNVLLRPGDTVVVP